MEHRKTVYTFQNKNNELTKQILSKYCTQFYYISQYNAMFDGAPCIVYVYNPTRLEAMRFIEVTANEYYIRIFAYYGTAEKPCPIDTSGVCGMENALQLKNTLTPMLEELNAMQSGGYYNAPMNTPLNTPNIPITNSTTIHNKSDEKKAKWLAILCFFGGLFSIVGACINFITYLTCSAITGYGSTAIAYHSKYKPLVYIGWVLEIIGFIIFMVK